MTGPAIPSGCRLSLLSRRTWTRPPTGTSNLTFSVQAALDVITPHAENNSLTLQMNEPQDIMVYNGRSPLAPDILQSGDESATR